MPFDPFSWGRAPSQGGSDMFGIDPQTMKSLMGLQFLSAAAGNLGNMGLQRGQQPIPQANPMAMITPMLQMQQMGMVGQERERKLAEQRAQASAYYGPEDKRAGGAGTWVNPDTGMPQYTGMISKVSPQLQPLLGAMDADKGTGTLATIMAQQMKPKDPTSDMQNYAFAKTADGGGFKGTFEEWKKAAAASGALPAAPIQNFGHRQVLVKQFGEGSPEVNRFDNYVRATQTVNLGDRIGVINPANPGTPQAELPINVSPNEDPDLKRRQAYESFMGRAEAEMKTDAQKNAFRAVKTLDTLEGVEALIDKSTGSFGGAAMDAMASMFGHATEGSIATGKLKVLEAGLVLNMPRLEGPQSNLDQKLYREAAAQIGDPTVPNAIKKAAVATIRDIQERNKKQGMPASPTAAPADPLGIR